MQTLLATIAIFALFFLSLSIVRFRGRHCLNCSCKAAERVMQGSRKTNDGNSAGHDQGPAGHSGELKIVD